MGAPLLVPLLIGGAGLGLELYGQYEARRAYGEKERYYREMEYRTAEAQRRQEEAARKLEEERQKFIAEQRRIAEERARIEKEKLLKDLGLQRGSIDIKEANLKNQQKEVEEKTKYKLNLLSRSYGETYSSLTALQTIRGVTQTLAPKQERLTRAYREQEAYMESKQKYKTLAFKGAFESLGIARKELELLEQYGKETSELNLQGIAQKASQKLAENKYRISAGQSRLADAEEMRALRLRAAKEELEDFRTASKIGSFKSILGFGERIGSMFLDQSLYSNVFKKAKQLDEEGIVMGNAFRQRSFQKYAFGLK